MHNQSTQMRNSLNALAGVLLALGICFAQFAIADGNDGNRTFTSASLQGTYAYVNSTSDVASYGLITFDGVNSVTATLEVNSACLPTPFSGCNRTIEPFGTDSNKLNNYNVNPDGTGAATINFVSKATPPITPPIQITYHFVISEATKKGKTLLATQVFAAGINGGVNGQLTAPTWTRISK